MDPSLPTIYESHSGTVYPLNAIASSSMSSLISPQDEHSSRMRSHKGNRPSLPQSKHCPLCPAKFTRTTHLNRHLRTRKFLYYIRPIPKLICVQTRMNDSIAATYVIPSTMCQPLLTIAFRHVFPSSPAVTSLQGTREVAVICESPSALESLSELISSPVLIRTSRVASRVKPAPSRK